MKAETAVAYPELYWEARDQLVVLRGPYRLLDGRCEAACYEIEVELPDDFPDGVPVVREVGGRIPRHPDRHINSDGRACVFVAGERWKYWPKGSSLVEFLNGPVKSFFIGQSLYELTGEWPFGQRSHGAEGVFEAYSEMMATTDRGAIVRYLESLARLTVKGHHPCPCGSGRRLRQCHAAWLAQLRSNIGPKEAAEALAQVRHANPGSKVH